MERVTEKAPASVWVVGVLALLWNLVGVGMFLFQTLLPDAALQSMPPDQRAVYEATPAWLYVFYGVATIGGALGALGLLLRRRWAVAVFLVALLALVLQVVGSLLATPAWSIGGAGMLVFPVILIVIATLLWWFTRRMARRGVLR